MRQEHGSSLVWQIKSSQLFWKTKTKVKNN